MNSIYLIISKLVHIICFAGRSLIAFDKWNPMRAWVVSRTEVSPESCLSIVLPTVLSFTPLTSPDLQHNVFCHLSKGAETFHEAEKYPQAIRPQQQPVGVLGISRYYHALYTPQVHRLSRVQLVGTTPRRLIEDVLGFQDQGVALRSCSGSARTTVSACSSETQDGDSEEYAGR